MKQKEDCKGFTLVELLVVIVIVGILASVAIPRFISASHKARASEFPTVLTSIYTAQEAYMAENGTYGTMAELESSGLQIPSSRYFNYTVTPADPTTTFTATATVKEAFGNASVGDAASITHEGTKSRSGGLANYAPNWGDVAE